MGRMNKLEKAEWARGRLFILPSKYVLHGLAHQTGVLVGGLGVGQHLNRRQK